MSGGMVRHLAPAVLICSLLGGTAAFCADKPVVLGYYPAWVKNTFPAEKNDFTILNHVIHAFAWPDSAGNLQFWEGFAYPELVDAAHKGGAKISVALGGWGQCAGFPPMTADPAIRKKFIGNLLEFCRKNGYDGADIDWEFPANPTEKNNLTVFVRELRAAADKLGNPFLITMAISAGTWSGDHNDYAALKQYVDWFNDMTYDFHGSWTPVAGHNAPLYGSQESVDSSISFLVKKMGVPPEKVVLGLPFYGRSFKTAGLFQPGSGGDAVHYKDVVRRIAEGGWKARFDDASMAPYLANADNTMHIFYDDPDSIMRKCRYAKDKKLRGVMIWALGSDLVDNSQLLLNAIGKAIR
jgi:chitinase